MSNCFSNIRYGPFVARYHQENVGGRFKSGLTAFLEANLLPQVDEPFTTSWGAVTAVHDDDRHCGPNSAIRNQYAIEFHFERASGCDTVKHVLRYDPESGSFAARKSLFLWTTARRERFAERDQAIRLVCSEIAGRRLTTAACPRCRAALEVADEPSLIEIVCPSGCFRFNYHRVPATGEFLHGHFFQADPE